ncbi:hypothetical protein RRG08_024493 [Elysia crispata]|uniref:Uncharacterized protein n=1 Tax=Elysia crispata TaxID=231223 RepID=A0AAE0YP66_9GAST|nr:hypothetical protein RRG08_024493 [Elysia crispata]
MSRRPVKGTMLSIHVQLVSGQFPGVATIRDWPELVCQPRNLDLIQHPEAPDQYGMAGLNCVDGLPGGADAGPIGCDVLSRCWQQHPLIR